MKKVSKDVGDSFDREMSRGYRTKEDYIDAGGAVSGHTSYPIIDQLKGESQKKWLGVLGDVDECNEFISAHLSLRGILKGTARAIMDESDPAVQAKVIEQLEIESIIGKALTVAQ